MELLTLEQWEKLFTSCRRSAWHLEMRDTYAVGDEQQWVDQWQAGKLDLESYRESRRWWLDLMQASTSAGKQIRRARIVCEPVSEYIKWEHTGAYQNVEAGEDIRWLPRHEAGAIALPANDFWLFDGTKVVLNYWTGDGDWLGNGVTEAPDMADLCKSAFEAVWEAAIPHSEYKLT
ncbi:DUF6879 family protein [Streptosporangium subroseum]|uniref:DUF6879 family protein n=1 Tax=Streptosporangium subroseum TaxID=106412 RepID=UPI003085182C|nr:hypothetical protein OHB15_08945 [Streptosporangium subroseum]